MKAIVIDTNGPRIHEGDLELAELQSLLGGHLERILELTDPNSDDRLAVFCNEDGIAMELPGKITVIHPDGKKINHIVGPIVIGAYDAGGAPISLDEVDCLVILGRIEWDGSTQILDFSNGE